ncbi:MAG: GGDEF domain-containing protein, partial [Pseudomonadota bacterium]
QARIGIEVGPRPKAYERLPAISDLALEPDDSSVGIQSAGLYDDLTGLRSRSAIMDKLRRERVRAVQEGRPIGLVMAAIDGLDAVVGDADHLAANGVICTVARTIAASVRPYDSIGRFDTQRFVIVLPGCGLDEAVKAANRLRSCFISSPVETPTGLFGITMTLAVSAVYGTMEAELHSLIESLDFAVKTAQATGGNRVTQIGSPEYINNGILDVIANNHKSIDRTD